MKTQILKWSLIMFICSAVCATGKAYTVHDPIHTVLNILQQVIGQVRQELQHAEDVAKYAEMIQKQMQQIRQLTTMINQNVEQLRRIGDPHTYVNMLGLDTLFNEMSRIKNGVGTTMAEFQHTVDGVAALKDTANGLYQDLSQVPDRFGKTVQYDVNSFKRFGAVQDMYKSFNTEIEQANRSLAVLQQEKQSSLQQLNSAGSLIEVQKLTGKLHAIESSIQDTTARIDMAAQKTLVQHVANQNDQLRMQQALLQQRLREVEEENLQMQQNANRMLQSLK
jgi:cell shape-determining protein MreC